MRSKNARLIGHLESDSHFVFSPVAEKWRTPGGDCWRSPGSSPGSLSSSTRVLLPGSSTFKIFDYQNFITRVLLPGSALQKIVVYGTSSPGFCYPGLRHTRILSTRTSSPGFCYPGLRHTRILSSRTSSPGFYYPGLRHTRILSTRTSSPGFCYPGPYYTRSLSSFTLYRVFATRNFIVTWNFITRILLPNFETLNRVLITRILVHTLTCIFDYKIFVTRIFCPDLRHPDIHTRISIFDLIEKLTEYSPGFFQHPLNRVLLTESFHLDTWILFWLWLTDCDYSSWKIILRFQLSTTTTY